MARNDKERGWKIAVRKNTKYADKVQLNNFNYYLKLTPSPPTSKRSELRLVTMEKGIISLFECGLDVVMNYVEGMLRGYRKNWQDKEYFDVHAELVSRKDYDRDDEYGLYGHGTFKNKVSSLVSAWNRKLTEVYTLKQKTGDIDDDDDHWKNPPFIRWSNHETFSCKKVMFYVCICFS